MQNPDELIMLFESNSSTHTLRHAREHTHAEAPAHTRTEKQLRTGLLPRTLPPSLTCSCLSPPIPSPFRFTGGRNKKKKKEMWKTQKNKTRLRRETRETNKSARFDGAMTRSRCRQLISRLSHPSPFFSLNITFLPQRSLCSSSILLFPTPYLGHPFFCFPAGVH